MKSYNRALMKKKLKACLVSACATCIVAVIMMATSPVWVFFMAKKMIGRMR